jgi:signal transduction histidine kinase/ActR/RegA family two-component response regulator
VVGSDGEVSVLARAFNDMTGSLRHWYEEARRRDDQLRQAQKMEAIGRLAGGVAHDFNNLLMAIRGYTELLLASLAPDDLRREDADEILNASDRAAGLTRQLLAFSRREAVTPRVLALDRVLPNIEQMLRRLIGEDITLTSEVEPGIWPIKADPGQIDQVLMNLAVNARDAMPSGGTLTIALSNVSVGSVAGQSLVEQAFSPAVAIPHPVLARGPYVRISVTDTGTGMTEETVQRIFEPFFTTKGEGRGTGLGLATVYGIVQHVGGTIDVVTAVGKGATFHVFLPRCDEPPTPQEPPARHIASHHARATETVLLVEDDHRVNTLIANVLRQSGYTVLAAVHGEEALALSREHAGPIHVLLTDVVMPGMNGRELSEVVSAERPDTRMLFMSGYPDDAIVRQGIQTASVQFLQKPFSMDVLIAKMRVALVSKCG